MYVYDALTIKLIKQYNGTVAAKKDLPRQRRRRSRRGLRPPLDLKIGFDTLKKYLNSNKPYQGKIFSSFPLDDDDDK